MALFHATAGCRSTGPERPARSPGTLRFERAGLEHAAGTSQFRSRWADYPANEQARRISTGDFLCRIWALYGPPDDVMPESFIYVFRDRETGAVFTAYSAGAGPGYGAAGSRFQGKLVDGPGGDGVAIAKAVDSFDALLEATKPQDCEIELGSDAGRMRVGVRNGRPYDLPTGTGCSG